MDWMLPGGEGDSEIGHFHKSDLEWGKTRLKLKLERAKMHTAFLIRVRDAYSYCRADRVFHCVCVCMRL